MGIFRELLVVLFLAMVTVISSCTKKSDDSVQVTSDCTDVMSIQDISNRGSCDVTLPYTNQVSITVSGSQRVITSNSIPDHKVGLFGKQQGALNPNAISPVQGTYSIALNPTETGTITPLLNTKKGPEFQLGVLLNGVLLDPEAAEPWPHDGIFSSSAKNWEWNLDAMNVNLGLDCNNAHVQPTGKYHYHGAPTLYLQSINISSGKMMMVGYAADGFPIYYKYGYKDANDSTSTVMELQSSYRLKSGERPGDGNTAPCGEYSGIYTNDYEYVEGLGDLDECNGRYGITPDYPDGTYYYVITDSYPYLSRCLKGTPSNDFRIQ